MPYREKTAWLALIAMAVTFGPYFALVQIAPPSAELPNLGQLAIFGTAAITQLLILGAGHLYLRLSAPQDARIPPDERDQAILRRSISSAYYVLLIGMILVGVIMPFTTGGWEIVNSALFMIVIAEAVSYSVIVVSYRRQS